MNPKHIITNLFGVLLVFFSLVALNASAQNTLSEEEKRFDLNGNGQLSEDEKETMIDTIAIEAFTGVQFTAQEIRG